MTILVFHHCLLIFFIKTNIYKQERLKSFWVKYSKFSLKKYFFLNFYMFRKKNDTSEIKYFTETYNGKIWHFFSIRNFPFFINRVFRWKFPWPMDQIIQWTYILRFVHTYITGDLTLTVLKSVKNDYSLGDSHCDLTFG